MTLLRKIWNGIVEARQKHANEEIAHMLQRTEFKNYSYPYVLYMVNNGRIGEIGK